MFVYTSVHTEHSKRGLSPYDDKRYLLADFADGSPYPNSHEYGHKDLVNEEELVVDMQDEPVTVMIIEIPKKSFKREAPPGGRDNDRTLASRFLRQ